MTRREEIEFAWLSKAVQSNHRYDEKSFKEAVEWADKTMLEKACEWLKRNAEDYVVTCYDKGELDIEGLIMDFRKAMEE